MSHEFESGVVANEQAWHGLAVVHVEADGGKLYAEEALEKSGLDWRVFKEPIVRKGVPVAGKFYTVRDSDDSVLGIVGSGYEPVQNRDGFGFLNDLVDTDQIEIETAMSLREGRRVVILARRPDSVLVAGEELIPYLCFTNTHDGSGSVQMFATPVRVVCQNTLTMALSGVSNRYRMRHTSGVHVKLEEARKALEISFKYTDELAQVGEWMAETSISDREFDGFLKSLVPIAEDEKRKAVCGRVERRREEIREVYTTADNLNNIRGTRWGALNAVAEWVDHRKGYQSPDRRFEAIVVQNDPRQRLDQRAMELLAN